MWWGYSPALDILSELEQCNYIKIKDNAEDLNVLLIGGSDARHIIKTIAQYYRHEYKGRIHFYVYEASMDLVARQIMFLTLALEPPEELGLFEKMMIFIELYGNTLIRHTTSSFIARKSAQFVHMVTDLDFQMKRMPILHLEQLKYRERDYLENVFKFWQEPVSRFPIIMFWDKRLRKHLGTRYDSRMGAFDWDFYMNLKPRSAEYISSQEYKTWRSTGIAFTWLETEVTEPNLTLATGAIQIGDTLCHHGYLGDIVTGPFIGYGLECEDKDMLKTANGVPVKRSTDIVERNLTRLLHEILHQQPYMDTKCFSDTYKEGVIITEVVDTTNMMTESDDAARETSEISRRLNSSTKKETYSAVPVEYADVTFLPHSAINDMPRKEKYKNFFDAITFSEYMTKHITQDFIDMLCEGGVVIAETKLYQLEVKKDDVEKSYKTLDTNLRVCHCEPVREFDYFKNSYVVYARNQKQSSS